MDFEENSKAAVGEETAAATGLPAFNLRILLVEGIKAVRKFWIFAIITVLLGAGFMYQRTSSSYVPMYKSTTTFSISTLGVNGAYSYYNTVATNSLEKAFPYIISSPIMTNLIKEELGVSYVNGSYKASSIDGSNIFTITTFSSSARDAYDILCAVIKCYPRIADYVIGETQMSFITRPEINETPYTSSPVYRNAARGAIIGFGIWAVFIALLVFTRNTVRSTEEIADKLGQQCIAEIPFVKRRKNETGTLLAVNKKLSLFSESYRTLRTRLLEYVKENPCQVIAVTSTQDGEGKTTVAFNTAYSLAGAGKKVALVELDFGNKTLHSLLFPEEPEGEGISDAAAGRTMLANVFKSFRHKNFHIFCAGSENKFINGRYDEIFSSLRAIYDFIIIDSPAGGILSGNSPVTDYADGVLFVIRQDKVPVGKIRDALENLFYSRKQIAGFVFNSVNADYKGYGGYYYGGYKYGSYRYGSYRYNSYNKYGYGRYGYGKRYGNYGYGYGYGYGTSSGDKNAELQKDESLPGENFPKELYVDDHFNVTVSGAEQGSPRSGEKPKKSGAANTTPEK